MRNHQDLKIASRDKGGANAFDHVHFRCAWRPYQARILQDFEQHAHDRHFHLVAPPGSGKTVLGLEIVQRLRGVPLLLSPSIAIREQWIQRFCDLFEGTDKVLARLSRNLREPGLMTVSTYQGLYSRFTEIGVECMADELLSRGVNILVFDEAHHLRKEWWKALHALKQRLGNVYVLALTATSPQDVSQMEWNRYVALCGPVDEEISIPELVAAGTLCPHQDYIYLTHLLAEEGVEMMAFDRGVEAVVVDLLIDESFLEKLRQHPSLNRETSSLTFEDVGNRSEFLLALHVYLFQSTGIREKLLDDLFGLQQVALPSFTRDWCERLLTGVLFSERELFQEKGIEFSIWKDRLQKLGAIEQKKVRFSLDDKGSHAIRSSPTKLMAIVDLVQFELDAMGASLRMVILTDYVRKEDLPKKTGVERKVHRLGVIPIFERIRQLRLPMVMPGILSGTFVAIPKSLLPFFQTWLQEQGVDESGWQFNPFWHDPDFLRVEAPAKNYARILQGMTWLLEQGHLNILVGTVSLLGQGWDAPTVNTLVLASSVSSFIGINQIRGRSLRIDPARPGKVSHIWHLVCLSPWDMKSLLQGSIACLNTYSTDLELLKTRLDAFPGLDEYETRILSGWQRLAINQTDLLNGDLDAVNKATFARARNRQAVEYAWRQALQDKETTVKKEQRMVNEVLYPLNKRRTHSIFRYRLDTESGIWFWLSRWRTEHKIRQMARALLETLLECGKMETNPKLLSVRTSLGLDHARTALLGGSLKENSDFVEAFSQMFNPLWPIRYLLESKEDIYAVPRLLGQRKEDAKALALKWSRGVSSCVAHSSNSPVGKVLLLQWKQKFLISDSRIVCKTQRRWI